MSQDLSSSFGEPATSRLRGLLPPRPPSVDATASRRRDVTGAARAAEGASVRPLAARSNGTRATGGVRAAVPDPDDAAPEAPHRSRASASSASASGWSTGGTNRRWGMARVASREHVDLLVLCALRAGPASGRAVVERLRADSGGALEAPERTVHNTLHRLARNRLLGRVAARGPSGPQYALTDTGRRVARARVREWRSFARAVDAVVQQDDQP